MCVACNLFINCVVFVNEDGDMCKTYLFTNNTSNNATIIYTTRYDTQYDTNGHPKTQVNCKIRYLETEFTFYQDYKFS